MSSEKGSILNFFSKSKKTANEVALEIDSHRRVLPQSSLKKTQPKSIVSLHTKTDQQSTSDCLQQPNPLESIAPVEMKSPPITQTSISMLPSYRARPSSAEGQRKRPKSGWASKVTQTTEIESTKRTRERFDLTDEQKAAVQVVLSGRSVFLTGGAGTGKSYTLTAIIWKLREVYGSKKVFVTASTGLAASAISGTTVHFFSGLGIGGGTPSQMLAKVQRNHDAVSRWQKAQVLIIDEISMIDADLFDALDHIACGLRENDHPMGGLQLVLCGDFLQLPPVNAERFAFESNAWKRLAPINLLLKLSMRQLSDSVFASILDQVRRGCLSDEVKNALESRLFAQLTSSSPGVEATSLFPRRSEADERNKQRLEALDGESYQFTAVDSGTEPYLSQLRSNCSAPTILQLKIGAQVVLLRNVDRLRGLVNGSTGVVLRFEEDPEAGIRPYIRFTSGTESLILDESWETEVGGRIVATRTQLPLTLAWALTVHKAQGMSLDLVETTLSSVFEYGQAYVALSRARTLTGVRLLSYSDRSIRAHPRVTQFYDELTKKDSELPLTSIAANLALEQTLKQTTTQPITSSTPMPISTPSTSSQTAQNEWNSLKDFQQMLTEKSYQPTDLISQSVIQSSQSKTPPIARKSISSHKTIQMSSIGRGIQLAGFRTVQMPSSTFLRAPFASNSPPLITIASDQSQQQQPHQPQQQQRLQQIEEEEKDICETKE